MQLTAVRAAVEGVGALVLSNYMKLCLRKGDETELTGINALARCIAIWGRVHIGDSDS